MFLHSLLNEKVFYYSSILKTKTNVICYVVKLLQILLILRTTYFDSFFRRWESTGINDFPFLFTSSCRVTYFILEMIQFVKPFK